MCCGALPAGAPDVVRTSWTARTRSIRLANSPASGVASARRERTAQVRQHQVVVLSKASQNKVDRLIPRKLRSLLRVTLRMGQQGEVLVVDSATASSSAICPRATSRQPKSTFSPSLSGRPGLTTSASSKASCSRRRRGLLASASNTVDAAFAGKTGQADQLAARLGRFLNGIGHPVDLPVGHTAQSLARLRPGHPVDAQTRLKCLCIPRPLGPGLSAAVPRFRIRLSCQDGPPVAFRRLRVQSLAGALVVRAARLTAWRREDRTGRNDWAVRLVLPGGGGRENGFKRRRAGSGDRRNHLRGNLGAPDLERVDRHRSRLPDGFLAVRRSLRGGRISIPFPPALARRVWIGRREWSRSAWSPPEVGLNKSLVECGHHKRLCCWVPGSRRSVSRHSTAALPRHCNSAGPPLEKPAVSKDTWPSTGRAREPDWPPAPRSGSRPAPWQPDRPHRPAGLAATAQDRQRERGRPSRLVGPAPLRSVGASSRPKLGQRHRLRAAPRSPRPAPREMHKRESALGTIRWSAARPQAGFSQPGIVRRVPSMGRRPPAGRCRGSSGCPHSSFGVCLPKAAARGFRESPASDRFHSPARPPPSAGQRAVGSPPAGSKQELGIPDRLCRMPRLHRTWPYSPRRRAARSARPHSDTRGCLAPGLPPALAGVQVGEEGIVRKRIRRSAEPRQVRVRIAVPVEITPAAFHVRTPAGAQSSPRWAASHSTIPARRSSATVAGTAGPCGRSWPGLLPLGIGVGPCRSPAEHLEPAFPAARRSWLLKGRFVCAVALEKKWDQRHGQQYQAAKSPDRCRNPRRPRTPPMAAVTVTVPPGIVAGIPAAITVQVWHPCQHLRRLVVKRFSRLVTPASRRFLNRLGRPWVPLRSFVGLIITHRNFLFAVFSTSPPRTGWRGAGLSIPFIGLDFLVLEDYSNFAG